MNKLMNQVQISRVWIRYEVVTKEGMVIFTLGGGAKCGVRKCGLRVEG